MGTRIFFMRFLLPPVGWRKKRAKLRSSKKAGSGW
jgi:hypothetical protein